MLSSPSKKFRPGTMLANFHMCGIMLVLRVVFNMLVRNVTQMAYVFYVPDVLFHILY